MLDVWGMLLKDCWWGKFWLFLYFSLDVWENLVLWVVVLNGVGDCLKVVLFVLVLLDIFGVLKLCMELLLKLFGGVVGGW